MALQEPEGYSDFVCFAVWPRFASWPALPWINENNNQIMKNNATDTATL